MWGYLTSLHNKEQFGATPRFNQRILDMAHFFTPWFILGPFIEIVLDLCHLGKFTMVFWCSEIEFYAST